MALKMISIVCMDVGSLIELVNLTLTLGIARHFYQHQQHEQNQKQGPIIQDGPYPSILELKDPHMTCSAPLPAKPHAGSCIARAGPS